MTDADAVRRRWRRGEDQLYPVVMVRPELYAACLDHVRAMAERLRSIPDIDALVVSYGSVDARQDLVGAGIDLAALPVDLDLGMLRDAAYQVRARELEAREASDRTGLAIRRARQRGDRVAQVWATGEHEAMPGYRRVEMSLATGNAVVRSTEMDAEHGIPRFVLEAVRLDPATGEATDAEPLAPRREFAAPDEWHAAAGRLRAEILEA